MSKLIGFIIVSLALTGAVVSGQESAGGEPAAAAEPYSYGYETDTHSAAEQRDPSGKVTGYYTVADADGRSRRVEYVADETGFRAKVATNEVGTKSENSADVEVQASPPTEAQYSYSQSQQVSSGGAAYPPVASGGFNQQTRYASTVAAAQPASAGYSSSSYYQQQQQVKPGQPGSLFAPAIVQPVGSGSGAGYASSSYYQQQQQVKPVQAGYSSSSSQYGYQPGYVYGPANQVGYGQYGYNNPGYVAGYYQTTGTPVGYSSGHYSSYNNHLPSQYYRSIQQVQQVQPNSVAGYASQAGQIQPAVGGAYSKYGSSSYRSSSYSSNSGVAPAAVSTTSSRTVTSGNPIGSSNYIVLKK